MVRYRLFNLDHLTVNPPTSAAGSVESMKLRMEMLENAIGKVLLINEALWELLRDKMGVTQDEFYNKLYEIDMRDGSLDGKNQKNVIKCPECQRPNSGRIATCIYCGKILNDSVFKIS